MPFVFEGQSNSINKRYAIVVSRFNEFISQRLLDGCLSELARWGVKDKDIKVVWVPGAFEIPVVALQMAKLKSINCVICLGAVIKGETFHFELVAKEAACGIQQVALITQKPIIFEVLATKTIEQAYRRAGRRGPNKGVDAARAGVAMVSLMSSLKGK